MPALFASKSALFCHFSIPGIRGEEHDSPRILVVDCSCRTQSVDRMPQLQFELLHEEKRRFDDMINGITPFFQSYFLRMAASIRMVNINNNFR